MSRWRDIAEGWLEENGDGGSFSGEPVRTAGMMNERTAKAENGPWYPACGGTEKPFLTRNGMKVLYCFQPTTGKHAYLNVDSDIFLSDAEARAIGL